LLFVQEIRASPVPPGQVVLGIGLTLLGVLSASAANILQASRRLAALPLASLLAWGMVYGVIANGLFAWAIAGPPAIEARPAYWLGLVYLGLLASALAFPLYFAVMRAVGPGKAAYSSVLVPILAMALSTLFEGYRWSTLGAAGGILALVGLVVALRSRAASTSED
jgi:drug/metabolite transporter (DMT)-like permease